MRVSRQRLWPQARRVQPERPTVRSTTADVRDDAAAHRGRHTDHPARPRPVRQGGRPRRRGVWGRILGVAGFPGHHVRTESPLPRLLASVTEPRTAGVSQWYDRLTRAAALLCRMRPSRDRPGGGPGVGPTLLEPAPEVRRPVTSSRFKRPGFPHGGNASQSSLAVGFDSRNGMSVICEGVSLCSH